MMKSNKFLISGANKAIFTDLFQRELSDEEVNKYSKEKERIYLKGISGKIKEVDGFTRFIESLGNMKRTIATSAPAIDVKFVMNKLGLRKYFDKDKIIDASMVTKVNQILKFICLLLKN